MSVHWRSSSFFVHGHSGKDERPLPLFPVAARSSVYIVEQGKGWSAW
jgi:hypothetical protein